MQSLALVETEKPGHKPIWQKKKDEKGQFRVVTNRADFPECQKSVRKEQCLWTPHWPESFCTAGPLSTLNIERERYEELPLCATLCHILDSNQKEGPILNLNFKEFNKVLSSTREKAFK